MSILLKKVNNHKVEAIPLPKDERPVRGAEICAEPYANIFLCGKKKSGKGCVIFHMLKHFIGKHTTVIIFSSTVFKDKNYIQVRKWLDQKKVEYELYTSLYEDGVNKLQEIINSLDEEAKEKEEEKKAERDQQLETHEMIARLLAGQPQESATKSRKEKLLAPDFIFVFDDLSHQLKDPAINQILCKNRHYLCKTIISSQYIHHLLPEARKQIDLFIIFRGLPYKKIEEIAKDADVSMPDEQFWKIYLKATKHKYSFLYLATRDDEMRRNFDHQFVFKEEQEDDDDEKL